jgi:hypothetical protein
MSSESSSELHVVMFPFFAFGHISPFVQLSNKLSLHGVRISFLSAPGNIARIKSSLLATPTTQIISLPIPAVEGLPPGHNSTAETTPAVAGLLKKALDLMQPQIDFIIMIFFKIIFIDFIIFNIELIENYNFKIPYETL